MSTDKIFETYQKKLTKQNKKVIHGNGGLDYFVMYLAMLRDYKILHTEWKTSLADCEKGKCTEDELNALSLTAALTSYMKYKATNDRTYWDAFWRIVAEGIEGWEENEHSIQ